MSKEISKARQNRPSSAPLFLPTIYWVLASNKEHPFLKSIIQNAPTLGKWEEEFIFACEVLGIETEQQGPFWNKKITELCLNGTDIDEVFANKSLFKLHGITGRIDQRITANAEPLGLIAFSGSGDEQTRLKLDNPTSFFESLFNVDGYHAAILMLSRLLTLPYPTIKYIKKLPRDFIISAGQEVEKDDFLDQVPADYANKSINVYAAAVYTQPLTPWFSDNIPSSQDKVPSEIINLVNDNPIFADENNWRSTQPPQLFINKLAGVALEILNKFKNQKEAKVTHMKTSLSKIATTSASTEEASTVAPQNLVLVGPPGTGKTRGVVYISRMLLEGKGIDESNILALIQRNPLPPEQIFESRSIFHVQFHPSYGYEDFVEGFRPVPNMASLGTVRYAIVPGPIKVASQLARAYLRAPEGKEYRIPFIGFVEHTSAESGSKDTPQKKSAFFTVKIPTEYNLFDFQSRKGKILIQNSKGEFDPIQLTASNEQFKAKEGLELVSGYQPMFWQPDLEVKSERAFVLIIDELNRGSPAKVFGELLSLLEQTKRLGQAEALEVLLPNSKEYFGVPQNLHIIATMNLSDRSLSGLDNAFRRRFKFIHLKPDFSIIRDKSLYEKLTRETKSDQSTNDLIAQHFECINTALTKSGILEDSIIGHDYALRTLKHYYKNRASIAVQQSLTHMWISELHPLLREILGNQKIDEFSENFEAISKELKLNVKFLPNGSVKDFLLSASPENFYWSLPEAA